MSHSVGDRGSDQRARHFGVALPAESSNAKQVRHLAASSLSALLPVTTRAPEQRSMPRANTSAQDRASLGQPDTSRLTPRRETAGEPADTLRLAGQPSPLEVGHPSGQVRPATPASWNGVLSEAGNDCDGRGRHRRGPVFVRLAGQVAGPPFEERSVCDLAGGVSP